MDFFERLQDLPSFLSDRWQDLLELAVEHAMIVLTAIAIATVIGVGLGMLTYRHPPSARVVLTVTGTFLTVPSLALFGLFIPLLGIGFRPTLLALVLYSLLPIVRNTITGLRAVDPAVVESAQGMGLSRLQRLRRIELPIAWPVILTGIRVSTLLIMSIAAIAAIVNGPGLGEWIFRGLESPTTQRGFNHAMAGTLGVVGLAFLLDGLFALLSKLTTSKGLR